MLFVGAAAEQIDSVRCAAHFILPAIAGRNKVLGIASGLQMPGTILPLDSDSRRADSSLHSVSFALRAS